MRWIWIALLCMLPLTVLAQDDDGNIEAPVFVDAAEIVTTEDGLAVQIRGGMGTGCDYPADVVQTVEDDTLYIEIYQLVPATVFCPMVLVEYNDTIPLELSAGVTRVVINDDTTLEIPIAQAAEETVPTIRSPHVIETVAFDDGELTISGFIPDGCEYPVEVEMISPAADWAVVAIFRGIPEDVLCPEIALSFTETIALDVTTTPTYIEVNDYAGIISEDETVEQGERQPLRVRGVTKDDNLLTVRGRFVDACDVSVLQSVTEDDSLLVVDIFRIVPEDFDDPCTEERGEITTIDVDLSVVDPGDYFYMVNWERSGSVTVTAPRPAPTLVYNVIETVTATQSDDGLEVAVEGYIPDGCETEVLVEQSVDDETLTLSIYRELPPGVRCPGDQVDYSETFTFDIDGVITVIVNEVPAEVEN